MSYKKGDYIDIDAYIRGRQQNRINQSETSEFPGDVTLKTSHKSEQTNLFGSSKTFLNREPNDYKALKTPSDKKRLTEIYENQE